MTFVPPPALGSFQFSAPYYTRGFRLTNASNAPHGCEGRMYPYWSVINNHRGRDELYVFVERTGQNPMVLRLHKASGRVSLLRELPWAGLTTGEGSYFSDRDPVRLYACVGNELMTTNVETGETATAFTLDPQYGDNVWQAHSSADDQVHSATARRRTADGPYEELGTVVVRGGRQRFIRASGNLDESHLTKNGRYLAIEQDDDLLVYDLDDPGASPRRIGDRDGAPAHADCGASVIVGEDNWHEAGALVLWDLADPHSQRRLIYASGGSSLGHVAIRDRRLLLSSNRTSELIYLSTDGNFSRHVAPGMIEGDYDHQLRACLDVLGEYGAWIAQIDGRLDLVLVRLPDDLPPIEGGSAVTPLETLKSLRRNYGTPMSADQLGELMNAVAWVHKDEGYGVLAKPSGGNCRQPRTGILISRDILMLRDGRIFDALMDAEGKATPTWGEKHPVDASRWRAPVDPAGAGTLPQQPPTPPPATGGGGSTMVPYDEAKAVEFGRACNAVYEESGAAFDPGMIAVHATRAAYDHYVGGMSWPESKRKHVNEFRAEYGLQSI